VDSGQRTEESEVDDGKVTMESGQKTGDSGQWRAESEQRTFDCGQGKVDGQRSVGRG